MNKLSSWILFIVLSFIWGSSFILMKHGMQQLTPYQVAALRIISAGLVLLPFAYRAYRQIPREKYRFIWLSGLLGSFFPAFLFCIAETRVTSSLAGILNALTPLFTVLVGVTLYKAQVKRLQVVGVLIGFAGLCLLPIAASRSVALENLSYALFIILATLMYGYNVNMVSRTLNHLPSIQVAALAFAFLLVPSLIILAATGYFQMPGIILSWSTGASCLLGVGGTAIATILFYRLIRSAGTLMASLVTYGIPFVAVFWGVLGGESISGGEIACLLVILSGVYLVNKK